MSVLHRSVTVAATAAALFRRRAFATAIRNRSLPLPLSSTEANQLLSVTFRCRRNVEQESVNASSTGAACSLHSMIGATRFIANGLPSCSKRNFTSHLSYFVRFYTSSPGMLFSSSGRCPMLFMSSSPSIGGVRFNSPSYGTTGLQQQCRHNSSFIQQVMNQVKKELEQNENFRKSMQEFKESGVAETSSTFRKNAVVKIKAFGEFMSVKSTDAISGVRTTSARMSQSLSEFQTNNQVVKQACDAVCAVYVISKKGFAVIVDSLSKVVDVVKDEKAEAAKEKAERWRVEMEKKRAATRADYSAEATDGTGDTTKKEEKRSLHQEDAYALILAQDSAWDRFGTKLRDMPFLHNFFENPMLGKLFGESGQAAALREMKKLDPSFRLPELVELTEHVIAPHLLHSFLNGEAESLKMQCGEAAFAAIDISIKEREKLALSLDPSVLLLRSVELKGAANVPDGTPWFIFTFTAQQINCMRNAEGEVVIGAVDDIREVVYSVALRKHPEPLQPGLEYPWQVTEFAIIGNTPCW